MMAYNAYFPATYQPAYPQQISQPIQYQQPQQAPQAPQHGIVWVQGEAGAKSYLVGAGNSVVLMDSENPYFFIKTADQSGMPTLRKFKFEEVTGQPAVPEQQAVPQIDTSMYITRDEFEQRIAELTAPRKTAPVSKKEVKANV